MIHPSARAGRRPASREGFTLLELIVVITIIGIFGTVVVLNVAGWTDKARISKAKQDAQAIIEAAKTVHIHTGFWPQSLDECVKPQDENGQRIPGTLDNFPRDPWGNEYLYELGEDGPIITCYGRDNQQGGDGIDGDIVVPEPENTY